MKKEIASTNVRIYPSSRKKIQDLADKKQAQAPGHVSPADVIHELLNQKKGGQRDK